MLVKVEMIYKKYREREVYQGSNDINKYTERERFVKVEMI